MFIERTAFERQIPARPEMVLRVSNNDALKASRLLGMMTAGAGLVEFCSSALFGRVSDKVGRKPMLILCATLCSFFRFLDFVLCDGSFRSVMTANWMDRLFAGACFPAAFTIINAFTSDVVLGKELAKHSGAIAAYAGVGVVLGPVVGAKLMQYTGNPKYCCLCASILSAVMAFYTYFNVDETLRESREIDWSACNPFSFLKLLRRGKIMATLAISVLLERAIRDMHDVKMILLKSRLGFAANDVAKYMLGSGLQFVAGSLLGKAIVTRLGGKMSALFGNIFTLANLSMWAVMSSSRHLVIALLCDTFAGCRSMSTTAALTTIAVRNQFTRGETAGMIANLSNVTKIVMPYLYTVLYSRAGQVAPFLTASLIAIASQVGSNADYHDRVDFRPRLTSYQRVLLLTTGHVDVRDGKRFGRKEEGTAEHATNNESSLIERGLYSHTQTCLCC